MVYSVKCFTKVYKDTKYMLLWYKCLVYVLYWVVYSMICRMVWPKAILIFMQYSLWWKKAIEPCINYYIFPNIGRVETYNRSVVLKFIAISFFIDWCGFSNFKLIWEYTFMYKSIKVAWKYRANFMWGFFNNLDWNITGFVIV